MNEDKKDKNEVKVKECKSYLRDICEAAFFLTLGMIKGKFVHLQT